MRLNAGFRAIVIMLAFNYCGVVRAGYDTTSWGMSPAQVRSRFPGGYLQKNQNGEWTYQVVKPLPAFPTVLMMFTFSPAKKLNNVALFFPEPETKVNLKTTDFTPMSMESAVSTHKILVDRLTQKYGPPQPESHGTLVIWLSPSDDAITLSLQSSGPAKGTAIVSFQKLPTPTALSNGL